MDIEAELRACSKYAGGGYFIHPDTSDKKPCHAPEVRRELLKLLDEARSQIEDQKRRIAELERNQEYVPNHY